VRGWKVTWGGPFAGDRRSRPFGGKTKNSLQAVRGWFVDRTEGEGRKKRSALLKVELL
jgi:hypothetical protein